MAAPYIEAPEDVFDYEADFTEKIEPSESAIHMSNDIQEATLVGYVRANKIRSMFRWFLGFAEADTAAPWRLRRENPQFHPEHPQLRAYDVSVRKLVPLANEDNPNWEPKIESPFVTGLETSLYKWAEVTIRFRNFMYRFREDSQIDNEFLEWRRHVWFQTEPRVESIQVSGGQSQLIFAETSDTGPIISPDGTTPFPAPIAMLQSKKGIVVNWYDVPWEFLSEDPDIFLPTKLDAIIGKVNSDVFVGTFLAGTLLAEPYRYTISTWAVAPEDANDPLRKVTLAIPFTFFDPERGGTKPPGAPFTRGHNLMPWGGNGKGSGARAPGGDGKYYLATRDGTTTGQKLLSSAAFSQIWTHVSAP